MAAPPDLLAVPDRALTVAAGQAECRPLDVAGNAAVAAHLVRQAAAEGAELLVLPELFLTGYELAAIAAEPERHAVQPEDGRLAELSAACAETRTVAVVGAAMRGEAGDLHISALVLGRDGGFAARYDKQHVDSAERTAGFAPGRRGCSLTLGGWRLGLAVCWDSSYPEHARAAALDGCQAYLVGAMFPGERGELKRTTVCPARALDNAMYVVAANHSGPSGPDDGCGGSAIWGPDGRPLAEAGRRSPGLAVARLEPDALRRARAEDLVLADPSLRAPVRPRAAATLA